MLVVNSVSKSLGGCPILRQVSFSLEQGDVLGLLGLNGAGKSTLLQGLAGISPFSSGKVTSFSVDLREEPTRYRSQLGFQPERCCLNRSLTLRDHVELLVALYDLTSSQIEDRLEELLTLLHLKALYRVPCEWLSKGEQQRASFLLAVLHSPKLLLLDEPMNGLDPKQMIAFRRFILHGQEQRITVISSHLIQEIRAICNKLLILHDGEVAQFVEDLGETSLEKLEKYFIREIPLLNSAPTAGAVLI